jgi:hypothetical protein
MLVHHRPLLERRPSWLAPPRRSSLSSSSMMGRESAKKPGVTLVPEIEETESSSSSGASIESSSSSSSNGEDVEEVIDVDSALDAPSDPKETKREWVVPRTLSWTPVKLVQPVTSEQRRSMGRSQRIHNKKKKGVASSLVVSTHRLTVIPESCSPSSSVQDPHQQGSGGAPYEDLVRRVEALELGAAYKATKEEVEKVEEEFLRKLRAIREALAAGSTCAGAAAVDSLSTSSKELEALRAENEALKRRNAKLEYRVQHVVGEMTRLYDQVVDLKMSNAEASSMAEF